MSEGPAPPSILARIARETSHFAMIQVLASVLVGLSTLVLARLLDQRAFGVYAIGTFFLGLGALLGDGGLGAALLRKREEVSPDEYRVTITALLALGAAMGLTFVVAMPWIAARFHLAAPEARILQVMAPLFLVGPMRAVPYIRLERELRFSQIARIELRATIARQLAAILLAWTKGGAWALAGGQLTGAAVQLGLAYLVSPGFPGLSWRWQTLRPLLGYGVKVQALGLAAFLKDNVSAVLLGTLMGPHAVGVFDFGVKYAQLPVVAVNALGRVQLPAYARFEAKDPALHQAVLSVTRGALLLGGLLLAVMAAGASAIIPLAYDPKWLESEPVVWAVLPNMAGGLVAGPIFALLQAQGRAGLAVRAFAVWTVATWAMVLAVRHDGLPAIAAAYSVATVAMVVWLVAWAQHHLGRPLAYAYVGPTLALVASGGVIWFSRHRPWFSGAVHNGWWAAAAALVVYAAVLFAVEGLRPWRELTSAIAAVRGKPPR